MDATRAGLLYAIAACCGWGFAFVGPLILRDWPPMAVAAGRYIAYGIVSVATLLAMRWRGDRSIWRDATLLTLSGNLLYYMLLSVSVQKAGYVLPTLVIGLLPVTVSLAGRLRTRQTPTPIYGVALILILAGLWLAHAPEGAATVSTANDYALGVLCAFGALALWTIYGVVNTERLKASPGISGLTWSSLQGAAALPFALVLFVATPRLPQNDAAWGLFIGISLVLGLITSWAANAVWNMASTRLPASLLGQMIVFETIAGIGYGAVWSGAAPSGRVLLGTALLIAGVVVALRERPVPNEALAA